jgi:hypothetical protein
MADNKKKRGGSDRGLIAINEPYEVRYWSKKFKVTPAVLKAAVKNVGRSSAKVAVYIKMKKAKKRDRGLIALSQAYEVHHWAKKFKTTPVKLKAAVKAVGRSTKKVAAYFSAAKKKTKRKAKKKK